MLFFSCIAWLVAAVGINNSIDFPVTSFRLGKKRKKKKKKKKLLQFRINWRVSHLFFVLSFFKKKKKKKKRHDNPILGFVSYSTTKGIVGKNDVNSVSLTA